MSARLLTAALLCAVSLAAQPSTVSIGVFGLFQPYQLTLRASGPGPLRLSGGAIEGREGAQLSAHGDRVAVNIAGRTSESDSLAVEGLFELAVPGKLARQYDGALEITARNGTLQAVVTMALETAVAAAVAGEADLDGPHEALLAQTVASRSYLASGRRHDGYDFCDTTHCQYLTDSLDERARRAAAETEGTLLWRDGKPLEALFTRSCDGRTRSGAGYQAVDCPICARQPKKWTRTHALADVAALIDHPGEQARIAVVRRLGWDAVPSNAYTVAVRGDKATFTGAGEGHGMGLCQRGAIGLARQGATWRDILHRYFPGAVIR